MHYTLFQLNHASIVLLHYQGAIVLDVQ